MSEFVSKAVCSSATKCGYITNEKAGLTVLKFMSKLSLKQHALGGNNYASDQQAVLHSAPYQSMITCNHCNHGVYFSVNVHIFTVWWYARKLFGYVMFLRADSRVNEILMHVVVALMN
jgi:hypothetical protein